MVKLLSFESLSLSVKDFLSIKNPVLSNEVHIKAALDWLKIAQDRTEDGGVAAWYSLATGWSRSYIETTGYIISTFLDCSRYFRETDLKIRAKKMADFLLSMQLPSGGFRNEVPEKDQNSQPIVFDTGQDVLGLVDIYKATKEKKYKESVIKAADFLCSIQEKDGSWVKFTYGNCVHTYNTRVAWALLKVFQITNNRKYLKHATANLDWAAENQTSNGWFKLNNFPPPNSHTPFTHNISYTIEGFLWSGLILKNSKYIEVAKKTGDCLLDLYSKGYLNGAFDSKWKSDGNYTCLTGDAQISLVWLNLFIITKDEKYLEAAKRMNNFLKSIQDTMLKNKNIKGAIKGSFPIYGDIINNKGYCRMAYLNWATKFFIDALLAEERINKDYES